MNNKILRIKIQQRLNKLASADYDNIECWQIAEAFNKAQREWFRRQVHGLNQKKESAEQSYAVIDDLQKFIAVSVLKGTNENKFFQSVEIPGDYGYFIRVGAKATKEGCDDTRAMTVYLAEEHNASVLLGDALRAPNFHWSETFATLGGDRFKVYTNGDFAVQEVDISYYRTPARVSFDGCIDPYTGQMGAEVECELRDDVVELIVDEAAAILAGDMDNMNQLQRQSQNAQRSN